MNETRKEYPNSGVLFLNKKKKNNKSPDWNGNFNIDGVEYWLSAWVKVTKNNEKFFSLAIQPKNPSDTKINISNTEKTEESVPF